jgi:acyl-CoA synthetase (AMP-forming)/AMP-acid ligase II
MPSRLDLNRWKDAAAATAKSGLLRPVGPRAGARIISGLWRTGLTPAAAIAIGAARHPDRDAIIDDKGETTYRELDQRIESIAGALWTRRKGRATFAVLCRNHRGFLEAFAVGTRLGHEVVFLNTEITESQLGRILERHSPDVLVYDEEYEDIVDSSGYDGRRVLAWHDDKTDDRLTLDSLAVGDHAKAPANHRSSKLTLLTSGTTGLAKGVSRGVNILGVAESGATGMSVMRLRDGDVSVVAPPFFHALGFAMLLSTLMVSGTIVSHRRFDPEQMIKDIDEHRATVLTGVPLMLQRLLTVKGEQPERDVSSIRVALTGASPIPPSTVADFLEAFGPVLVNVYGSTETGIVSMATPDDLRDEPSTLGRPGIGISVRILRDDRSIADAGERGTIFMRGGLLFDGYTADGDNTPDAKEVVDGHINTGDMGHMDDLGRLYVDGRDDDMVVSGGENVFPLEVEHTLGEHPSVDEAVVMGIDHEEFGQVLRAYVTITTDESPKDEELRDFLRDRLERFKVPKQFVVLDDFPRNATGKIVRSKLADPNDDD